MTTGSFAGAAVAHPNIALIKYWGKRCLLRNLPAVGSLSITLDVLRTVTQVRFDAQLEADDVRLNGEPAGPAQVKRVQSFLDLVRQRAKLKLCAAVETSNNFPTSAGLASSASGFAALAMAACEAAHLDLSTAEISALARQGSGSAARSVFGGYVKMACGESPDGHDALAEPILAATAWPLAVVIAITAMHEKSVSSTIGMERSRRTSPFYRAWLDTSPGDLEAAHQAILARDFAALADVSEHSCLKMHAVAGASRPPLVYWNGATLEAMHAIRRMREAGVPVFFTVDAGPQVKAVCLPQARAEVQRTLQSIKNVREVLVTGLGPGAFLTTSRATTRTAS